MLRSAKHFRNPLAASFKSTTKSSLISTIPTTRFTSTEQGNSSEIQVEDSKNVKVVTLNRPKALNALNLNMVRLMTPLYEQWNDKSDCTKVIILKGSGEKAFCAGGDIKEVIDSKSTAFFKEEYHLDQLIGNHNKCHVALIDGITMGGGVGLSVHGKIRVASERTLFAMPESGIGFFCDVGGSYFLPRLKKPLGMYLALTGARLKGKEVVAAGIATHFVPSSEMARLEKLIIDSQVSTYEEVDELIKREFPDNKESFENILEPLIQNIKTAFSCETVPDMIACLKEENSEFSQKTLSVLNAVSPTSLRVIYRQMIVGEQIDFGKCFEMELDIAKEMMKQNDFKEGVRALLVDKDKKFNWNPKTLEAVKREQIDPYFQQFLQYIPKGEKY